MKPPRWEKRVCSGCLYVGQSGPLDLYCCYIGSSTMKFGITPSGGECTVSNLGQNVASQYAPYIDENKPTALYYATLKLRS